METAEAHRVPLGPAPVLAHAVAHAGCALARCRAVAPVVVLSIPVAGHREGLAGVSRIALANSGLKWHYPQRGVSVLELPQGEGGRWILQPGTHQVHV